MKIPPFVSVITASNRPELWTDAYENINKDVGDLKFEYIFVGPVEPGFELPNNVRYIKTNNIKVTQCFEIGIREAKGDMLLFQADDVKFWDKGMFGIYSRYLELCAEFGDDNVVVVPGFKDTYVPSKLRYNKYEAAPIASLNSALVSKDLLDRIGGIDTRLVGVYWDCDLAMRLHEIGVRFERFTGVYSVEFRPKKMPYRLHSECKPYDREVLDTFWTRFTEAPEPELPEDAHCYAKDKRWVVTKKRQKEVSSFSDENILVKSQGPNSAGRLTWE